MIIPNQLYRKYYLNVYLVKTEGKWRVGKNSEH